MSSFDERAKDWDSDPVKVERARVVAQAIRSILPKKMNLSGLEVGCGTGLLSFALQQDFASISMADTSEGMLAVLGEKIKAAGVENLHPLKIDLSTDPLPAERFDVIFNLMTLHHIPDTRFVLKQFYDLANPSGILCISDLEKEDGSFHGQNVTDVHQGFDQAELTQLLTTAGFTNIQFSTIYQMKKIVAGAPKTFPLFMATAEKV